MDAGWLSPKAYMAMTLTRFRKALPVDEFLLRFIPADKDSDLRPQTRRISFRAFVGYSKAIRYMNAKGYHVYGRPNSTRFALVDDLCEDAIDDMVRDRVLVAATVETSEGSFQAWVPLAGRYVDVPIEVATAAAQILAERYDGDLGAAYGAQLGRIPCTRNLKAMHERSDGSYPWAMLRRSRYWGSDKALHAEAIALVASASASVLAPRGLANRASPWPTDYTDDDDDADDIGPIEIYDHGLHVVTLAARYDIGDVATAYERVLVDKSRPGYIPLLREDGQIDRSAQDLAVARFLVRQCVPKGAIEAILLHGSEKANERSREAAIAYVRGKIEAACKSF